MRMLEIWKKQLIYISTNKIKIMKKLFLIVSLFYAILIFAQMAVTDVGATAQLAQSVSTATKSLSQLNNTYKVIKEANDKIQKVNNYVEQANYLQNIINKQKQAINNANQILKLAKTRKLNLSGVNQNLNMISGSVQTVQALLKNGLFNMNDSERLERLESEYNKVSQAESNIKTKLIQSSFR